MCCGSNADVPPQTNTAKCWAIPNMVFTIISCIGFLGGAWVQGIGGILGLIACSIQICCGPTKNAPNEAGKETAAGVLYILGAICEIGGAILGLLIFLGIQAAAVESCTASWGWLSQNSVDECVSVTVDLTAILIFPSVGLGVIAGALQVVSAFMSFKSMGALKAGGATPTQAV